MRTVPRLPSPVAARGPFHVFRFSFHVEEPRLATGPGTGKPFHVSRFSFHVTKAGVTVWPATNQGDQGDQPVQLWCAYSRFPFRVTKRRFSRRGAEVLRSTPPGTHAKRGWRPGLVLGFWPTMSRRLPRRVGVPWTTDDVASDLASVVKDPAHAFSSPWGELTGDGQTLRASHQQR